MSNIKSEFEKNVIHKQILDHVRFSEKSNQYLPVDALSSVDRACADVANVGWISYQYQQSKINELQKRVDAAKQLIEDLNKCYQQDHQNKFEYWRGFADSAGILRKRLEQALKGGEE